MIAVLDIQYLRCWWDIQDVHSVACMTGIQQRILELWHEGKKWVTKGGSLRWSC